MLQASGWLSKEGVMSKASVERNENRFDGTSEALVFG